MKGRALKRKIPENLYVLVQPVEELYCHQGVFFCHKASKYRKESETKEKMECCAELRVDERIRQIATVKHDSKILSITSDELVVR